MLMDNNPDELQELKSILQTGLDFTLYVHHASNSDSQDSTSLLPLEQLERSFEEMDHDLYNLQRVIEWLFLYIQYLRRVPFLPLNLPQGFFRIDEEKGDAFVRGLVNDLIERHNNHKQLLYAEGQRGAKAREGASEGGRITRQKGQQKHETWRAMASAIWQKQPSLSIRAVADLVARQCQGNPEFEGKADTIRQRISGLRPSAKKSHKTG